MVLGIPNEGSQLYPGQTFISCIFNSMAMTLGRIQFYLALAIQKCPNLMSIGRVAGPWGGPVPEREF